MVKILKYLRPKEWGQALIGFAFIFLQVFIDLKLPDFMKEITSLVQTEGSNMGDILLNGGLMLACAFSSLICSAIIGFFAARISASFSQRLRSLLFDKVSSFSLEEINRFSTSSLITRSTNDITQIQMLVMMVLQVFLRAPITVVWAIIKISGKGFEWSMVTAVASGMVLVTVSLLMVFVMPKFRIMQTLTDNITRVSREGLMGVRVVRAYNAEKHQEKKFEKANEDITSVQLFASRSMAVLAPIINLVMGGLSLFIYWIGAYLIEEAAMMPEKLDIFSNMVVFSQYALQIVMSFMMLVMIFVMLPRAAVSAKRINEVLDTKLTILDGKREVGEKGVFGEIEFRNVSFGFPDASELMLKDISFKVKKGETLAVIGSTGSGKSTLVNLILRTFDTTKGEVLVDKVNVKDYKLEKLLDKIGYVPQKAVLFRGSVSDNVCFGENTSRKNDGDAVESEVRKSIEIAQGTDFVEKMDGGYNADISQGGSNISGGQKQRISIARAVYRKPEIYVFDDSFSALDNKTDYDLRAALKKETKGVTSIIVAQRVGTIIDSDQIIVLDEGEIVGKGTHSELIENCEVYKEIALSQLSEGELHRE